MFALESDELVLASSLFDDQISSSKKDRIESRRLVYVCELMRESMEEVEGRGEVGGEEDAESKINDICLRKMGEK